MLEEDAGPMSYWWLVGKTGSERRDLLCRSNDKG